MTQLFSSPVFAQQASDYRAIVCLFLAGGLDCNNAVVPMDSYYAQYAANRIDLAIPQSQLCPLNHASNQRAFGLHPMLANTASLFNSGQAAVLANVGTIARPTCKTDSNYADELPNNLFSHPAQIGSWETALSKQIASTGWAGRVADELLSSYGSSKMPAVVSTGGYQLLGTGRLTDQLMASDGNNAVDLLNTITNLKQYFEAAENGQVYNNIQGFLASQQSRALDSSQLMRNAFNAGTFTTEFPGSNIGQQMQVIAKLIAGRSVHSTKRQIFVAIDSSYDSHSIQNRLLNDRLSQLDAAIGAFAVTLKEIGMFQNVTVFTCSDFGRSLLQNLDGGTDHAWGGHHFIIGGAVKGGQMYGTYPTLELGGPDDINAIGNWIPTTATTQYMASMAKWLGVSASSLYTIFPELPNFTTQVLPFI